MAGLDFLPGWLTEARAALIISTVSAIFTGFSVRYARRMALNDSEKMRRKLPIVECSLRPSKDVPGWQTCNLVVRNLEPVTARLLRIRTRSKKSCLLDPREAMAPKGAAPLPLKYVQAPPEKHIVDGPWTVAPVGTRPSGGLLHIGPDDTAYITLLSKGVRSLKDLHLEWEWGDGHKP